MKKFTILMFFLLSFFSLNSLAGYRGKPNPVDLDKLCLKLNDCLGNVIYSGNKMAITNFNRPNPKPNSQPSLGIVDIAHDYANTNVILKSSITDNGGSTILACGFRYTIEGDATVYDLPVTPIVQSGNFQYNLDLSVLPQDKNTTVYSYATNSDGTTVSSPFTYLNCPSTSFSCGQTNLTATSVTLQSSVLDDNGLIFLSYAFRFTDGVNEIGDYTASGNASAFSYQVTGLTPGTTYYYYPHGWTDNGSDGANMSVNCQFTTPAATIPILSDATMTHDFATTAVNMGSSITDNGGSTITACGFKYTIEGDATIYDLPLTAVQTGKLAQYLDWSSLPSHKDVTFYAYATNGVGTGVSKPFTYLHYSNTNWTCAQANLTSTSVTLQSAVLADGGMTFLSYGFYLTDGTNLIDNYTASGNATSFSADVTGLKPGTTYYYYPHGLTSDSKDGVNMSINCQFTTPATSGTTPIISACNFSVDATTTTFIGTLESNGGSTVTECGFYWGTSNDVTTLIASGTKIVSSTTVQSGNFSYTMNTSDLPSNYYYVPYATNGNGTAYGLAPCSTTAIEPEFSCSSSNIASTSATLSGTVVDAKGLVFVKYGFMVISAAVPDGVAYEASGSASGFSFNLTGLTAATQYYFAPYGEEAGGNKVMGKALCDFTTTASTGTKPIITACNFTGDKTTVTFIGTLDSNGGSTVTECGFYWGTSNDVATLAASGHKVVASATVQSGNFSVTLNTSDLPESYYYVPYAINGNGTAYGLEPCSKTVIVPEFSCSTSDISSTSVTLKGAVLDDKGLNFVKYGFMVISSSMTDGVSYEASGSESGFSYNLTGLTPATQYYFVPYGEEASGNQASDTSFCDFTTTSGLKIPNAFTPNGDNINDLFVIEGIDGYPNCKITIINRWGNKVFESQAYKNDWDGKSNSGVAVNKDEILPEGVYFYILDLGDGSSKVKGSIYLKKE